MKYSDGSQVQLGDQVLISGKYHGVVVADIDGNQFTKRHPREQWGYLGSGAIIDTNFGGLVHYQEDNMASETIQLVSRGQDAF